MSLHTHKVRSQPGLAEFATVAIVAIAVLFMLAGPVARPGTDWQRAEGRVKSVYTSAHPTHPDGKPRRVQLVYQYDADGLTYTGEWDGEWPEAHSPNALLAGDLDRLRERDYPLKVLYDPVDPSVSNIHGTGNRLPAWWLRLSLGLAMLAMWHTFVVYPSWKLRK